MRKAIIQSLGTAAALAALVAGGAANAKSPARKVVQSGVVTHNGIASTSQPNGAITLSIGRGQIVNLSAPMSDLFIADTKIADVQVRSPTQLYVFGTGAGETTVYATNKAGGVIFSTNVRVGTNLNSIGQMLKLAMPEADITATPMNGVVLLTGTVASPDDVAEAQSLVQAFVGKETQVLTRIKTAVPMQVNLRVKIAEVNREFAKEIGVNLLNRDTTGGFLFGIAQGRTIGSIGNTDLGSLPQLDASSLYGLPSGSLKLPFDPTTGQFITKAGTNYNLSSLGVSGKTAIGLAGHLFGMDLAAAIDLAENDGLVSTLAEPNLTALSGETASFLAGGEIPIPISTTLGQISIEYKQYGVSLAFTPVVLADGRISMRVRPEVSQLSDAGSVKLNSFTIPGITTRRAETTVELGSGQSFMIGGLLNNNTNNTVNKAPFLGDLPILGNLFKSQGFKRSETELVIIVTPYLVKPSSAKLALPTDGFKASTDLERYGEGQTFSGKSGEKSPRAKAAAPVTQPTIGSLSPNSDGNKVADNSAPVALPTPSSSSSKKTGSSAAPGFSIN
jgi:pilus assembly protein CpaC